jgi:hypothetical protein
MKKKITLERTLVLTTEVEVSALEPEDLEARTKAMIRAIGTRGVKALPPVNWDVKTSTIRVCEVEKA